MKILEIIDFDKTSDPYVIHIPYYNTGFKLKDVELNKRLPPEVKEKIIKAWLEISAYVRGGGGNGSTDLDVACNDLMTYYRNKVIFTGNMYRAIEIPVKELSTPDIRLMSAKLHAWDTEFARKTISWSTDPSIAVTHRMGQPTLILHQKSSGVSVDRLDIDEFAESEVLSPVSNSVSIYGFAADEMFFPVDDFKEFVKFTRSMDLSDWS
jgi:hypothetical protein